MTNLQCSVQSCRHYKDNCCCKPEITIVGKNAHECSETSCKSYKELPKESSLPTATNGIGVGYEYPNKSLHVACEAENCTYCKNSLCRAKNIKIKCGSNGSECASFRAI